MNKGKFITELSRECLREVKRDYYTEYTHDNLGRFPYMNELVEIDDYVSDEVVFEMYKNNTYHKEDFDCTTQGIEEW